MPHVTVRGINFHTATLGEGSPVVMIHGLLLGSLASWYFTVAPALSRTRRVFLYDLRGHGRSERVASGYDVATMTDDLTALVDAELPNEAVALVGHSYGALIALRFAMRHPERVSHLVLVEAPLPPPQFAEVDKFLARSPDEMLSELPEEVRGAVAKGRRQARKFVESVSFLTFSTSLVGDLRSEPDIDDGELAKVTVPTLCLYGKASSAHGVGERLARVMPNARLVSLEGGHFLHLDAAAELTHHVGEFLAAPGAGDHG